MAQIVEYGTYTDAERSHVTVLRRATKEGREYTFYHATAGYQPAGACARWTDEKWGVYFWAHHARHGRMYSTRQPALELFEHWTEGVESTVYFPETI